jgi:hypothetical protein
MLATFITLNELLTNEMNGLLLRIQYGIDGEGIWTK